MGEPDGLEVLDDCLATPGDHGTELGFVVNVALRSGPVACGECRLAFKGSFDGRSRGDDWWRDAARLMTAIETLGRLPRRTIGAGTVSEAAAIMRRWVAEEKERAGDEPVEVHVRPAAPSGSWE